MQAAVLNDVETDLAVLNEGYMRAVQNSDVRWFESHLADDFLNTDTRGTLADRRGYIEQAAKPVPFTGFAASDVVIRVFGDVAVIHGRTTYTKTGGEAGAGRYTDVWARRQGRWVCIAAQVMRG